ncbi:MAG TPA: DCC1-like thiol-disulfide oxidoreductase family protein [Geothrix sp.]|jgi:predicted DCC family thiol-disulfide oxidoreductase YuxK
MPAPLLIAYDPACILCCRMALWLARRDRRGLLHIVSLRDPDLVALAPELAGRPLEKEIHGLDLGTRQLWAGPDLLRPIAQRLPGWRWGAPILALPGLPGLLNRLYLRWAAWRFRRTGRPPFA